MIPLHVAEHPPVPEPSEPVPPPAPEPAPPAPDPVPTPEPGEPMPHFEAATGRDVSTSA